MPRPTRSAAAVRKNYSERNSEEEEEAVVSEDDGDDSFDEDDDPDKIEVPGGGKTLEAAVQMVKGEPSSNMRHGLMLPPMGHSSSKMLDFSMLPVASPSTSGQLNYDGGYASPLASQNNPLLNPFLDPGSPINPLFSPLNPLFAKFLTGSSNTTAAFAKFYTALLASNPNQLFGQGLPLQFQPGLLMNQIPQNQKPLPGVNVSNLWAGGMKMNAFLGKEMGGQLGDEEEDNQEDEDLGVAETYSDYKPSKLKIGRRHPDPVVETASLASVLPPEVYYKLHLPDKVISLGALSALQLEAVVYACQQHEHLLPSGERAGYLVGDGAGVGKGRTIAGIIFENHQCGRTKAIWVSVSTDLKYDSERDLKDIGSGLDVYPLNKFKYGRINSSINNYVKKGVIFSTYSSLIGESSQGGKFNTRLKQLLDWCGKDFDGVIVFDECHRAKNLCPVGSSKPTKTGQTVFELQKQLPKARVVYASATGASEPKNMAYMTRLGIWGPGTPFKEFNDFINAVEKRGIGAMEIVAMDMKLRGTYIARQLSFQGVAFNIEEVSLSPHFISVYDESVQLWVEAMQKFIEATELMKAESRTKKAIWAQFWSAHQRFFKYLCIASKVEFAVKVATESVKCGKCVVIGLQSTGEARTLDQLEKDDGDLTDFVSTAKGVFQSLVEKHFPAPNKRKINELLGLSTTSSMFDTIQREMEMDQQPCSSSSASKRKPVRKAAQKAVKRVKMPDSDDSDSDIEDDSDYNHSGGSSSESYASDSEASNDEFHVSSDMESDDDDDVKKKKPKRGKPAGIKGPSIKSQNGVASKELPSKAASDRAWQMKTELLEKIEQLGDKLPPNTLDQLIDELGGPDDVAEMTGRKGRVIQTDQGQIQYESRSETDVSLETINLTEKQRFMNGEKEIAIISEAASSGISLQSDRRAKNQRRRVHITLELPWSADRAIQQFGRTHRSNQVNAPEYVFLISDLAGEHRFASIVAKRLESLGALTHGDRRATESRDLSRFHIDNKYGRTALESVMKYIIGWERSPIVKPPADYVGDFRSDVAAGLVGVGLIVNSEENRGMPTLEKDYNNMSKFLNRILGMPVKIQNSLFKYFIDTLNAIVAHAKKTGRFDMGILDLGEAGSGEITKEAHKKFLRKHATGKGEIELHKIMVERGMSWGQSQEKHSGLTGKHEGYYLSHQVRNDKQTAMLAIADHNCNSSSKGEKKDKDLKSSLYSIYRPNTGLQARRETLGEIQNKGTMVKEDVAQKHWVEQYESSKNLCTHAYWRGNCKNRVAGMDCEIGLRCRTYHVLSGAVLLVWDEVERVLTHHAVMAKMQIVRVKHADGKLVGLLIPNSCANALSEALRRAEAEEVAKEKSTRAMKEEFEDEEDEQD